MPVKKKEEDHLLTVAMIFIYLKHILHLPRMILEEMMEIQDMGKVLYLSLTMRVHSFIKKGGLNINLGDV